MKYSFYRKEFATRFSSPTRSSRGFASCHQALAGHGHSVRGIRRACLLLILLMVAAAPVALRAAPAGDVFLAGADVSYFGYIESHGGIYLSRQLLRSLKDCVASFPGGGEKLEK